MHRLGQSLDDALGVDGEHPLSLEASVRMLHEAALTLRQMHAAGVLHGDVSSSNLLEGPSESWLLIDPSPPELSTENCGLRHLEGEARDVVALAQTFLSAYYGVDNYTDDPEDEAAELEQHPELLNLIRRMLGHTRHGIPAARRVAEELGRIRRIRFTA